MGPSKISLLSNSVLFHFNDSGRKVISRASFLHELLINSSCPSSSLFLLGRNLYELVLLVGRVGFGVTFSMAGLRKYRLNMFEF